jgi:Ca2+-transporting ATPase
MTAPQFHATPPGDVLADLEVRADEGLAEPEARLRLREHGPNLLREHQPPPWWRILLAQLRSSIVGLLLLAAAVAWAFGEHVEAGAIFAVIAINTLIGFLTELRAVRSMEALRKLGRVRTRVRRGGEEKEISAQGLVPGDIVLLEGGDVVTADLRIVEASRVEADEAILTGESIPVAKSPEPVQEGATLPERTSMVFKGTALTRGAGTGVVVSTGMATELGRIAALTAEAEDELTPLEERLDSLGGHLLWVTAAVVVVVTGGGIASGRDLYTMLETGISLAVATVPEGLPIVATMALARGMWRLARRNALISSLAAVETLGATTVVLTDKTGTLTRNRLRWTAARLADGEVTRSPDGGFLRGDEAVSEPLEGLLGRLLRVGAGWARCAPTRPWPRTATASGTRSRSPSSRPRPPPVRPGRSSSATTPRCARRPSTRRPAG